MKRDRAKKDNNNNNIFLCMFIFNVYKCDSLFFDVRDSARISVQE